MFIKSVIYLLVDYSNLFGICVDRNPYQLSKKQISGKKSAVLSLLMLIMSSGIFRGLKA